MCHSGASLNEGWIVKWVTTTQMHSNGLEDLMALDHLKYWHSTISNTGTRPSQILALDHLKYSTIGLELQVKGF